ncbi:hypothetical protein [Bacillus sp. 1P06AnD]|uniref:hypothetical protein n=1 Tax=Bacillus sp. 1P06AnD TaxID=3132208 RepID=UPI0039A2DE49
MKKIPRTVRVRSCILKTYYYLRALHKIHSNEEEAAVFERITREGIEQVQQLSKDKKRILLGNYRGERFAIGGTVHSDTMATFKQLGYDHNWSMQETIEVLIYFSALSKLDQQEQAFFSLQSMNIEIL